MYEVIVRPISDTVLQHLDNYGQTIKFATPCPLLGLVTRNLFSVEKLSCIPVWNSNEDLDKVSSFRSQNLSILSAFTSYNIFVQISTANKNCTFVSHLKRVMSWSGLHNKGKHLNYFSQSCSFGAFVPPAHHFSLERLGTHCSKHALLNPTRMYIGFRWNHAQSKIWKAPSYSPIRGQKSPDLGVECPAGNDKEVKWP